MRQGARPAAAGLILSLLVLAAGAARTQEPAATDRFEPAPPSTLPIPVHIPPPRARPETQPALRPATRIARLPVKPAADAPGSTSADTLAAAPPSQPAPPPPPAGRLAVGAPIPQDQLEALVDGAVGEAMAVDHVPGMAVSVVQNGQILLKKGYGLASMSPQRKVDPDQTLFRLGSVSKLLTWIAVMRQVEQGRMRLDASINQYLPEGLRIGDQGFARPVLLRDLMTHSAGFEDRTLGRLYERDPGRVRALAVYLRQERPRRVRAPGEIPEYSDYGAALAGEAVSQTAGRPFDDLIEADILRPLGMNQTTFREPYPADPALPAPMPAALAAKLAQGYRWTGAGFEAQPFEFISQQGPAGSASSTAGDMARFMDLILAGGRLDGAAIYGAQSALAFRTVLMRSGPGIDGWSHGFRQETLPGGFEGFGHPGGALDFASNLTTVPALGLGVFVAGNSAGGQDLARRLPGMIVGRFYAPPQWPPQADPALASQRRTYAGSFLTERRRYGGLEQFAALLSQPVDIDVTADGRLLARGAEGGEAFVPAGGPGRFREIDGLRAAGFQLVGDVAQRWLPPSGLGSFERLGPLRQRVAFLAMTALALAASAATLAGILTRDRRDFRQTSIQGQAGALQAATAVLWFGSTGIFVAWGLRAMRDPSLLYYEWPGAWVLLASSLALVAALCSLGQTLLLPAVWRGGRRLDSWSGWRKLRFSLTTLIFLAFAVLLAYWGALEPWSG